MKTIIKDNASIIAAILLPVLFAGFFFVSKNITSANVEKPKYDVIVANKNNSINFDLNVINDTLTFTFRYPTRDKNDTMNVANLNRQKPEIYYIHADTFIAEPIGYLLPVDAYNPSAEKEGMSVPIRLEKYEDMKMSATSIAPDAYEISKRDSGGGNIMTELYQRDGRNRNNWGYSNGSSFFPIRGMDQKHYYKLEHVGWVIKD